MQGFAELKVVGGKLLKAQIEFDGSLIAQVHFFGDFFLHPEETIKDIEKKVQGSPVSFSTAVMETKIVTALKEKNAELIGATPKDFVLVLKEAIKNARE